jgi:hypothetical protein
MAFTEEELRRLGLLPPEEEEGDKPAPPALSAEEVQKLGIPVEPQDSAVEAPPTAGATTLPDGTEMPTETPTGDGKTAFRQFTTDQYNDLPFEEALKLYREYMDDPNTSRPILGLGYAFQTNPETGEKTYIQSPKPNLLDNGAGVGSFDLLATGAAGLVGNGLELLGAGLDYYGVSDNAAKTLGNVLPRNKYGDNLGDSLTGDALPLMLVGGGIGGSIYKALTSLPKVVRGLAAVVSTEGLLAALQPTNSSGVFLGENPMIQAPQAVLPLLKGVPLENADEAEKILGTRINLFLDGLMTGGIISSTISGVAAGTKLAWNLTLEPIFNLGRADKAISERSVTKIFEQLEGYRPNMSEAEKIKFREELADLIEQNKTVLLDSLANAEDTFEVTLDTLGALLRGLDKQKNALKDAGVNTTGTEGLIGLVQGVRRGFDNKTPMTDAVKVAPQKALDEQTDALINRFGGDTPQEQNTRILMSADEFAEQGRQEVLAARDSAKAAEADYAKAKAEFVDEIGKDLELTAEIEALGKARGTEIAAPKTASQDQVVSQLETAYTTMKGEKNARYAAIEGGPVDVGALYDAFASAEIDNLSAQSTALQRTTPLSNIAKLLQPRRVPDVPNGSSTATAVPGKAADDVAGTGFRFETREEVIARVEAEFAKNPEIYNFGLFNNVIRPELSDLANSLYGKSDIQAGNAVRQVIRSIDEDMVDFVAKTDPNLADAAIEGKRYYVEEFAPFWRDGRLEEFADLMDRTAVKPTNRGAGQIDIVTGTIREGNAVRLKQFRDLLERPEAGANSGALADYMVYDTIGNMAASIRAASDISEVPIGELNNTLRQYSEALTAVFPEKGAELTSFIKRVEAAQGDLNQLKTIMEEAQAAVDSTKEAIQASELANFFRGFPDPRVSDELLRDMSTTGNAFEAFKRIFTNSRDSYDLVDALMERIKLAPDGQREILEAGMRTAYAKYFRSAVVGDLPLPSGVLPTKAGAVTVGLDGRNQLYELGDRIFRDQTEVMEALRAVSEFASESTKSRNAIPIPGQSPTAFNQDVSRATNRIIYATSGPLSRTGTRIRSIMGALVETVDPTKLTVTVTDRILANPDEFVKIARAINAAPTDEVAKELLLRSLFWGITRPNDEEGNNSLEGVPEFLADQEVQIRDGMSTGTAPTADWVTMQKYDVDQNAPPRIGIPLPTDEQMEELLKKYGIE